MWSDDTKSALVGRRAHYCKIKVYTCVFQDQCIDFVSGAKDWKGDKLL